MFLNHISIYCRVFQQLSRLPVPPSPPPSRSCTSGQSDFDALHSFVDALQQSLVLGALEAVLVGVHVGQGAHVAVEVLLGDWLLLWHKQQPISAEKSRENKQLCAGQRRRFTSKTNTLNQSKRCVSPARACEQQLTMCGRRILARLRIRARLRPDSSMNKASFCSSIILFSCSMLFRFFSMEEICNTRQQDFCYYPQVPQ